MTMCPTENTEETIYRNIQSRSWSINYRKAYISHIVNRMPKIKQSLSDADRLHRLKNNGVL